MDHDWSFHTITSKDSYDLLVKQCNRYSITTVLRVYNSSVSRCQSILLVFESSAKSNPSKDEVRIHYTKMDYTPERASFSSLRRIRSRSLY